MCKDKLLLNYSDFFSFFQHITLPEMPAVLVLKDGTYFVYDGKFNHQLL